MVLDEMIGLRNWWWLAADVNAPDLPALVASDGKIVSRQELISAVAATAKFLCDQGIQRGDRLAMAMEPGIGLAVSLLAAMGVATVVPLPQFGPVGAVEDNLRRLRVTTVVVALSPLTEVIQAANALGLPILRLEPFRLKPVPSEWQMPRPALDDLALLMQSSGTTSRPKVVPLTHRNILAGATGVARALELGSSDRVLAATSMFHIHGIVATLLAPLLAGGSVICCRDKAPRRLIAELNSLSPTWLSAPPTMLLALLDEAEQIGEPPSHSLRFLRSAMMPLSSTTRARLEAVFQVPVLEVYGMTEASSQICSSKLSNSGVDYRLGTVGLSGGLEVTVLGPGGERCLVGTEGEIAIRGPSVTLGYEDADHNGWAQDERGERWFMTGDQGFLDALGHLTLTGRLKEMINRGGMKINPLRVDEALILHPDVEDALTFPMPHPTLGEDLMAAVVLHSTARSDEQKLREHLVAILPVHEVPSGIIFVEALPKSTSGKPLRNKLAEQLGNQPNSSAIPHQGDLEQQVASIFAEVIGKRPRNRDDNFFMLGGDSLSSLGVLHRLEQRLGLELSPTLLFFFPTVRLLADRLDQLLSNSESELPRSAEIPITASLPIVSPEGFDTFPASFGQARLWFLQQAEPRRTGYHLTSAWRLRGHLDRKALDQALCHLIERHPTLRTSFRLQANTLLQVINPLAAFRLQETDLGDHDPTCLIDDWVREEGSTPFDLGSGILIRGQLLKLAPQEHVLMLSHHHIASDGWSRTVLTRELVALYNSTSSGSEPSLRPLGLHYQDYAVWQRERIQGGRLKKLLNYWTSQLNGLQPLILPTDKSLESSTGGSAQSITFELDSSLLDRLEALCQSEGATLHMGLLASVALLLHRVCEQDDFAVGVPSWGRDHPDLEPIVGFFVNTVPIRARFPEGQTFRQLLSQIRETSIAAYDHQDLPFDQIVKALGASRDASRNPVFQVMLQYISTPLPSLEGMSGLDVERLNLPPVATRFDLEFIFRRSEDGKLGGELIYSRDLFRDASMERLVARFAVLVSALVKDPEKPTDVLTLLSLAERGLIEKWQSGACDAGSDQTVDVMVSQQASRSPDAIAVVFNGVSLTYAELERESNRWAQSLVEFGVGPDVIVAIKLDRSVELLISILAILKAGGAYLPLDPAWPEQRCQDVLKASAAALLITDAEAQECGTDGSLHILRPDELSSCTNANQSSLAGRARSNSLAYVLYTSGSTGRPKGVAMPHRPLTNLLRWQSSCSDAPMRTLQFASPGFDVSFQEIFSTWSTGGTLYIASDHVRRDPSAMLSMLDSDGIERLFLPVVMLEYLAQSAATSQRYPNSLRQVCVAGEALRITENIREFFAQSLGCALWNHYGPTETHVVTAHLLSAMPKSWPDHPPIGKPINNTQVYVLDQEMQPMPIGLAGDIWIGGAAVARGYWRNSDLTEERFVTDPFSSGSLGKLYRTGDRGRWNNSGELEFLGRTDNQVKIRGHRVELEEIEAVLLLHPDVGSAVTVACGDEGDIRTIAAFIVGKPKCALRLDQLRSWLRVRLPDAMIPSQFLILLNLPLNANGKVDRKSLEVLASVKKRSLPEAFGDEDLARTDRSYDLENRHEPQTLLQEHITIIWRKLFDRADISPTTDFFEIGGDSLMAVRTSIELESVLGHPVPITMLFTAPTVRLLAESLSGESWIPAWTSLVALKSTGTRIPLFCIHGMGGDVFHFSQFAKSLSPEQPVYGVRYGDTNVKESGLKPLEELATEYADEIRAFRPSGPYFLAGYSLGGWFAYAVATELRRGGQEVRLFLFDTYPGCKTAWPTAIPQKMVNALRRARRYVQPVYLHGPIILKMRVLDWPRYIATRATVRRATGRLLSILRLQKSVQVPASIPNAQPSMDVFIESVGQYSAFSIQCDLELFQAPSPALTLPIKVAQAMFWKSLVRGNVNRHQLCCRHGEIFSATNVPKLAEMVNAVLIKMNTSIDQR